MTDETHHISHCKTIQRLLPSWPLRERVDKSERLVAMIQALKTIVKDVVSSTRKHTDPIVDIRVSSWLGASLKREPPAVR